MCERLYEAPCPCPEADGVTCKSKVKCDRNNLVASPVTADPRTRPQALEEKLWFESVQDQIEQDVPVQAVAQVIPEEVRNEIQQVPFPASEIPNPDIVGDNMPGASS